ncbi:hypothetical protein EHS25_007755 [Saitozyma podzolica]|uniref:Uncharacterized protein n=1 Tax=Saitozyma podzolica TaxID=1890683 RepID=A0A427YQP6_9TREE|nr:hypothetical protein EHS25_007755 [Saitozyma podzolica]
MNEGADEVVEEEEEGAERAERAEGQGAEIAEQHEEEAQLGAERGEDDELQDQSLPRGPQSESDEGAVAAGEKSTLSVVETRHELVENEEGTAAEDSRSRYEFDIALRGDKHVLETADTATPTRAPKLEPQSQPKLQQLMHLAHPHLAGSRPDHSESQAHFRTSYDGPIKSSPHSPRRAIKSSPRSPSYLQRQPPPRDHPGSSVGIKVYAQSPLPPQPPQRERRVQPQSGGPVQPQPLTSVSARIGEARPTQGQMQTHTLEKLGGWKPDLIVHSGLTGEWIKERTDLVRAKRARAELTGRKSLGTGAAA